MTQGNGTNRYLDWAQRQSCDHPLDSVVLTLLAMRCDQSNTAGGVVRIRLQDLVEAMGGDSVAAVRGLVRLDELGLICLLDVNAVVFCTLPNPDVSA